MYDPSLIYIDGMFVGPEFESHPYIRIFYTSHIMYGLMNINSNILLSSTILANPGHEAHSFCSLVDSLVSSELMS